MQSLRKNLRSGLLSSVFYVSVFQIANDIDTDRLSQETLLTDMIANEENNCQRERNNCILWKPTPDIRLTEWMSPNKPEKILVSTQGYVRV